MIENTCKRDHQAQPNRDNDTQTLFCGAIEERYAG